MSVYRRNVMANAAGQIISITVGLVAVPFYVLLLGESGYGLVSFFLSLRALILLVDFGLSTAIAREVSLLAANPEDEPDLRNLLRTGEVVAYAGAAVVYTLMILASGPLTQHWLQVQDIPHSTVITTFWLAGGVIALRIPALVYSGFLRGTERQVAFNVVTSGDAIIRAVVSILVLLLLDRSLIALYVTQLILSLIQVPVTAWICWRGSRPGYKEASFSLPLLKRTWAFGVDVGVLSLLAMVIKQADKMIISGLLPIAQLGFFNSASMAANALTNLSRPVQIAVFPRLTRMAATPGDPRLASTFHQACRVVTFVTAAPAAVLVFFPYEILAFWTRSIPLAEAATVPLMLLALAMMINVSTVVPFALQLAAGITWLPVRNNAIWALAYPALVYGLVSRLGIVGAGWAWVTYNAIYAVTVPAVMFRHILKGEFWKWFGRDTLPYMVLALGLFWGAATLAGGSGLGMKAVVAALAAVVYVAVALSLDSGLRRIAVTALSQLRRR